MTTIGALLARGTETLARAGIPGPERDARRILAHVLGLEASQLVARADDPVAAHRTATYLPMIDRRAARTPLSHIVGYRDFWKSRFHVTPDVLDPRPETETLVSLALERPAARILDLGTGSGCILISLLLEWPEATGVGTDMSETGILVAGRNAAALGVADRIILPLSDWYDDIGGRFDLIVSNPPYIAAGEMAGLAADVRDHEPHLALTDGADGYAAYRTIVAGAPDHLTPGGRLMVEIGPTQAEVVRAFFNEAGFGEITVHPDLDGRDRVVSGTRPIA